MAADMRSLLHNPRDLLAGGVRREGKTAEGLMQSLSIASSGPLSLPLELGGGGGEGAGVYTPSPSPDIFTGAKLRGAGGALFEWEVRSQTWTLHMQS